MSGDINTFEGELIDETPEPVQPLPALIKVRRGQQRLENITVEQVERFFGHLEKNGVLYRAAELAGLSYQTINRLKKDDEDFKALVNEAMQVYREVLEQEAHRRAVTGWDEPVFSQKTGEKIGTVKRYDSKLLELMLKRHIPEFREKFEGEIKISGGVLIAPVAPVSVDDWLQQHGTTEVQLLSDQTNSGTTGASDKPEEPK